VECIRCPEPGTVLVHQVDAGSMEGDTPGPRTADILACDVHAEEIGSEPGAWPWLAQQKEAR
jgi:hypothetical protein